MSNLRKCALGFINKKVYKENVDPVVLKNSIGIFSNKKKEEVMEKKNLDERTYHNRYNFLSECYSILENGYVKR